MTSKEIADIPAGDLSTNTWLREIAMQLALLNEKPEPEKRGPGRPPKQR